MAFNIIMQKNSSEKNKLDKTLETVLTLSGTLRSETSLTDPIIIVEGNIEDIVDCNYMTISSFNRSYFITNIKALRNELAEITAHVDVLSTYKNEIRNLNAVVKRQENRFNLYLNDGTFKTYQNPYVVTKNFPNGFTTESLVLAVAGG